MLRIDGWGAGEQLSGADSPGQEREHCDHRGVGSRRATELPTGSVPRLRWRSVRHLHSGNDSRGFSFTPAESSALNRRHPRRTLRKSLPLHRLRADFRSRRKSGALQGQDMRSDPADYELVAPGNLREVVALLAEEPGTWLAIAGGTDVMVQYAAGKL